LEDRLKTQMRGFCTNTGLCALCGLASLLGLAVVVTPERSPLAPSRFSQSALPANQVGVRFAIADLDGDRKPDLAVVEMERREAATNQYSIRLRFGAGTEARIGVSVPRGGLRLAAKDVNGDDKVDLVVTSDFEARVIEVLLNDGHGKFFLAEPGAYGVLAADPDFCLRATVPTFSEQLSIAQFRPTFESEESGRHAEIVPFSADSRISAEKEVSPAGPHYTRPGRAPPLIVSLG